MREIKFRALLNDGDKKWWEYYTTFTQPAWLDLQDVEITVKDLQYTNLKDKNGKEIYEGDIVKYSDFEFKGFAIHKVMWYKREYVLSQEGLGKLDKGEWMKEWFEHRTEIIGNIYENKEMIK